MLKQRVLLLFGGESPEHDVSIASARNVYNSLSKEKYDVSLCYIVRSGEQWLHVSSFDDLHGPILTPRLGKKSFLAEDEEIFLDVLMPILHGSHGEDGDIQGLARLLHVPCVGPSLIGAAMTMDKDITKRLLREGAIPVVDWMTWHTHDERPRYEDVTNELGEVIFIKPSGAGSSVGVSKVRSISEFEDALSEAARFDSLVLIERAISCREIEVAVLGNREAEVTQPGEIIPGQEFYSYDDKYALESTATSAIPATVPPVVAEQIRSYALQAYRLTRGSGMARVDFFLTDENTIYLNEINSIPGFTDISMYPKLWQQEGMSYSELLDRLISYSLEV